MVIPSVIWGNFCWWFRTPAKPRVTLKKPLKKLGDSQNIDCFFPDFFKKTPVCLDHPTETLRCSIVTVATRRWSLVQPTHGTPDSPAGGDGSGGSVRQPVACFPIFPSQVLEMRSFFKMLKKTEGFDQVFLPLVFRDFVISFTIRTAKSFRRILCNYVSLPRRLAVFAIVQRPITKHLTFDS